MSYNKRKDYDSYSHKGSKDYQSEKDYSSKLSEYKKDREREPQHSKYSPENKKNYYKEELKNKNKDYERKRRHSASSSRSRPSKSPRRYSRSRSRSDSRSRRRRNEKDRDYSRNRKDDHLKKGSDKYGDSYNKKRDLNINAHSEYHISHKFDKIKLNEKSAGGYQGGDYQAKDSLNAKANSSENSKTNNQNEKELSNTLVVLNLGPDVSLEMLEDVVRDRCLDIQTSMPDDIRLIESLRVAYLIFPSIPVATKVFEGLNGSLYINGNYYKIDYTPNLANNHYMNPNQNKTSITYITNISDSSAYTTAMETTVHEDWICEFCDCKNFSKRVACFRCKRNKTINCRIIPVIKQKTTVVGAEGQVPPSTSLMIRGNAIRETDEGELLEIFSQYAQVKDIRMIRDKITAEVKDFAFVEYFTVEEAAFAINQIKKNPIKIKNQIIYCTFSKIRRPEDYKDMMDQYNANYQIRDQTTNQIYSSDAYSGYERYDNVNQYGSYNSQSNQSQQQDQYNYPSLPQNQSNSVNLMNINTSHLSQEEQEKLMNITNIQNSINNINNPSYPNPSLLNKDIRGEKNLKRDLSDREKAELELKKWTKEQKKMEKINKIENLQNTIKASLKNISMNFEAQNNVNENEYEEVVTFDTNAVKNKPKHIEATQIASVSVIEEKTIKQNKTEEPKTIVQPAEPASAVDFISSVDTGKIEAESDEFICFVCQRKFKTVEKLKIHEDMSAMHKENLLKMNNTKQP